MRGWVGWGWVLVVVVVVVWGGRVGGRGERGAVSSDLYGLNQRLCRTIHI